MTCIIIVCLIIGFKNESNRQLKWNQCNGRIVLLNINILIVCKRNIFLNTVIIVKLIGNYHYYTSK